MRVKVLHMAFWKLFNWLGGGGCVVLFLATSVFGQSAPAAKEPTYDRLPVDLSQNQLPSRYRGHSLMAVFYALADRLDALKKDEFESTAEYRKRVSRIGALPISSKLPADSLLAFSFIADDHDQFTTKYDADRLVLDVRVNWIRREGTEGRAHLSWDEETSLVSTYVGRNAFNRATRVGVYRQLEFLVSADERDLRRVEKVSDASYFFVTPSFSVSLPMSPDEARILKGRLRILVIGSLSDPPVSRNSHHTTPTIDEPKEIYSRFNVVRIKPHQIWFYDFVTGRIYLKLSAR